MCQTTQSAAGKAKAWIVCGVHEQHHCGYVRPRAASVCSLANFLHPRRSPQPLKVFFLSAPKHAGLRRNSDRFVEVATNVFADDL